MSLHLRPARAEDLGRVHELTAAGSRGIYDPALLEEMPRLRATLLRERRLELHVFIDEELPPAQRIQGVASGAFVTDEFAGRLLNAYVPYVARHMMAAELSGGSVLLSREQIAVANAGRGLNAVGLDFAFAREDWSVATMLRWTPLLLESLRLWLEGWTLQAGIREVVGRDLYLTSRAIGVPVFHRHTHEAGRPLPPRERRYLMGMTREQSDRHPVALSSLLFFQTREPRFGFTPSQQDLLLLALRNQADDECACELFVSEHTVKMRWRSIFERVAAQRPDWFPPERDDASDKQARRGVEKRRHLLAYLKQHMEEVRPRQR